MTQLCYTRRSSGRACTDLGSFR